MRPDVHGGQGDASSGRACSKASRCPSIRWPFGPPSEDPPIDAAWLAGALSAGDARTKVEHLEQFGFGQRVFGDATAADMPDVFVAVRAHRTYRALMTTLERMGIRKASLYAAAAHQATRVAPSDATRAFLDMAQFQGALGAAASHDGRWHDRSRAV